MKIAIISDLHGSLSALEQVLAQLAPWQPDHYLLLGDLLNHGPRNPVPPGYAPAAVAERLNQLAPHIMAVRGNCDSEVDQMLLNFPMTAPYNQLLVDGRLITSCWWMDGAGLSVMVISIARMRYRCPPAACLSAATPIYPCCSEKGSWC